MINLRPLNPTYYLHRAKVYTAMGDLKLSLKDIQFAQQLKEQAKSTTLSQDTANDVKL